MKKIFVATILIGSSVQAMVCPQLGNFNYKCVAPNKDESAISITQSIHKGGVHSFIIKDGDEEVIEEFKADGVERKTRRNERVSIVGSCEDESRLRVIMTMDLGELGKGGINTTFTKVSQSKLDVVMTTFGEAGNEVRTTKCEKIK